MKNKTYERTKAKTDQIEPSFNRFKSAAYLSAITAIFRFSFIYRFEQRYTSVAFIWQTDLS